jgi:glycerol-3-phosphate acyltransferase PlsY
VASMVSAAFAPIFYLFGDRSFWYAERSVLLSLFMISMLLVFRHRENINKLVTGKESKLKFGKKPDN